MNESSLLRLALIMEDQSATTVDKYVCKLVECVLFYSQEKQLSSIDLCKQINEQYQLEFDVLELENSIKNKARGRIICINRKYQLTPKAIDQLSKQSDPASLLKEYISQFLSATGKSYDKNVLLAKLQEYLYYCFNSSANNLLSLLQSKPLTISDFFPVSNEMVQQINEFISWDNSEKNKLLYDIISFSYEYCMLTTKKDTLLSKKIFRGKRFFLDTNIIFRMAGINKDERQFVTESFINKCKEVGIELYYTSETLNELYRVIEGQIKYIKFLTYEQPPVDSKILQSIDSTNEINDFYVLYYNWCREPQNRYYDYLSFQNYLIGLIRNVIENLKLVNIPNHGIEEDKKSFEIQCSSLENFKKEKRPNKSNSKESLQTDINNILYILSLRNMSQSQNLWQTNEYIVSADQLLTAWAKTVYTGIPIVVIPSTWLSIMLRFTGRSTDDYKAYCLFMGLRQHKTDEDTITINPISLLSALARRTSDKEIKQRIIEEILNNKSSYSFNSPENYSVAVESAFEQILKKSTDKVKSELTALIESKEKENAKKIDNLNEQLQSRSTEDEYIMKIANNKANRKVEKWKRLEFLQVLLPVLLVLFVVAVAVILLCKIQPLYNKLSLISLSVGINGSSEWAFLTWLMALLVGAIPNVLIIAPLKYLSSEGRKQVLIKKYSKEGRKYLS